MLGTAFQKEGRIAMRMSAVSSLALICVLAAVASLYGAPKSGQGSSVYSALKDSDVLVSVNGMNLTKGDLEGQLKIKMKVAKSKAKKLSAEKEANLSARLKESAYRTFLPLALFATEAKKQNIVPSDSHRMQLEQKYCATYGSGCKTAAEMFSKMEPVESSAIKHLFELDLLSQSYISMVLSTQMVVTAAEVSNQVANTIAYNQRMALTNALIYAQASNVLARARAGADFSELADEFSQDEEKEPGGDLGFCAADDFSLESSTYWENIVCLKPGEITDVMESEAGIEIVKFLGEKEDVYGDGSKIERHLARIVWHTALIFDTDEKLIRAEMEKERKNDVIRTAATELQKKATIVYPHGEDVVFSSRKRKRK
jgi:parvulin-like peptidyl-prolyl isomerase